MILVNVSLLVSLPPNKFLLAPAGQESWPAGASPNKQTFPLFFYLFEEFLIKISLEKNVYVILALMLRFQKVSINCKFYGDDCIG